MLVSFGEEVVDFDFNDLIISSGTLHDFEQTDLTDYMFGIIPNQDGEITIDIPAGAGTSADSGEDTLAATQFVIISDRTAPELTVPADETIVSESFLAAFASQVEIANFLNAVTATDAVDTDIEITSDASSVFMFGANVITFTAIDDAGNQQTAQATLTIEAPTGDDFCEGNDHWCDGRWFANVQILPDANLPIVPVVLHDPVNSEQSILFAGNALAIAHDATPGSATPNIPLTQVFLSIGFHRPTSQGEELFSSVRGLQFYSSGDNHIDEPVADRITLLGAKDQGLLNITTELTAADETTGDQFSITNDFLLHEPNLLNAITDVSTTITNTSGKAVQLAGAGAGEFHRRLSEQWVPITINSMFVARDWNGVSSLTGLPDWYQQLDPNGDYVSFSNLGNGNPLDDGRSVNQDKSVSTHDVAQIETENQTIVFDHETLPPVNVDGTQAIVLYRDSSDFVQLNHAHDRGRDQRVDLLSASGLLNSVDDFGWSVIYDRNDPSLVDGDNIQVRLTMDEQIGNWPSGASQSIAFRVTSGDSRPYDLGDAPLATQSGLASDYPTLLIDDGPRHLVGSLFLGSTIDAERNGQPSANAVNDGVDEDGVGVLATAITTSTAATTTSLAITASELGKLDAWIDFNADGDWDDTGEQIAAGVDVAAGENALSFQVPTDSVRGGTVGRFRLSKVGQLGTVGPADHGEVEDHVIQILDGANSPDVNIDLVGTSVAITAQNDRLTIIDGQSELFSAPRDQIGATNITGTSASDFVQFDISQGISSDGVLIDAGNGIDNFRVVGNGVVNLSAASPLQLRSFESIDLGDPGETTVLLDSGSLSSLAPELMLAIVGGEGDSVQLVDPENWRMDETAVHGNQFRRQIRNVLTNAAFDTSLPFGWHNLVNPLDVDNSGGPLTPFDALLGINVLSQRNRDNVQGDELPNPISIDPWLSHYVDTSADDNITPFDILLVINGLTDQENSGGGGEGELVEVNAHDLLPIRRQSPESDVSLVETTSDEPDPPSRLSSNVHPQGTSTTTSSIYLGDLRFLNESKPVDWSPEAIDQAIESLIQPIASVSS